MKSFDLENIDDLCEAFGASRAEVERILADRAAEREAFSQNLMRICIEKKTSIAELATKISLPAETVQRFLADCLPQKKTVEKMAKALGVSYRDLWPFSPRFVRETKAEIVNRQGPQDGHYRWMCEACGKEWLEPVSCKYDRTGDKTNWPVYCIECIRLGTRQRGPKADFYHSDVAKASRDVDFAYREEIAKYLPTISLMSFMGPQCTIEWLFEHVTIKP